MINKQLLGFLFFNCSTFLCGMNNDHLPSYFDYVPQDTLHELNSYLTTDINQAKNKESIKFLARYLKSDNHQADNLFTRYLIYCRNNGLCTQKFFRSLALTSKNRNVLDRYEQYCRMKALLRKKIEKSDISFLNDYLPQKIQVFLLEQKIVSVDPIIENIQLNALIQKSEASHYTKECALKKTSFLVEHLMFLYPLFLITFPIILVINRQCTTIVNKALNNYCFAEQDYSNSTFILRQNIRATFSPQCTLKEIWHDPAAMGTIIASTFILLWVYDYLQLKLSKPIDPAVKSLISHYDKYIWDWKIKKRCKQLSANK